jgi:hypothetical protein
VLLLDARGYDGSEGDPNVFGWGAAKDIDAAPPSLAGGIESELPAPMPNTNRPGGQARGQAL